MYTLCTYGNMVHRYTSHLRGLSTDPKPTKTIEGYPIENGSSLFEIDTGKFYFYNIEKAGTPEGPWVEFV